LIACAANVQSRVKKGKMSKEKFEMTLGLVKGVLSYDEFRDVDIVIEVNLTGIAYLSTINRQEHPMKSVTDT
jgi:hypothetical protein